MKVLVCLMILGSLIFAEETESDSSALNPLKPLKQQKILSSIKNTFSYKANTLLSSSPNATEGCINVGCCLIPLIGGIKIGEQIFAKDTTKYDTLKPAKKKWNFSIEYSGGICWTGEDFAKPFEASPIAGLWQLPAYLEAHLYWLNSFEGYINYPIDKRWATEFGIGFGWAQIRIDSSCKYQLKLFSPKLGVNVSKHSIIAAYIYAESMEIGSGSGFQISHNYCIYKFFALKFNFGKVYYSFEQDNVEYKMTQPLNGFGVVIRYQL
jgi:hypothetical protein